MWTARRARWYARAAAASEFPTAALAALEPYLVECRTVLDVGAGVGILAIPLAQRGKAVTALEPSPAMFRELGHAVRRARAAAVRPVRTPWNAARPAPHDMVLAANVPGVVGDLPAFARRAARLARRWIVVVLGAGGPPKFFFDELYPLLFHRPYDPKEGPTNPAATLRTLGLRPEVRTIAYGFDQPVRDLDEAVAFWRSYLPRLRPAQVALLRRFLRARLVRVGGELRVPIRRQSLILAWRPSGRARSRSRARPRSAS